MLGPTFNTLKIMNRTFLINALEGIATADGYSFYSDSEERMSEQIKSYPAVWLQPPKFQQMEGRKHGKVTYGVTLHAMDAGAKLSPAEREQTWSRLEDDLVEMFSKLSVQSSPSTLQQKALTMQKASSLLRVLHTTRLQAKILFTA